MSKPYEVNQEAWDAAAKALAKWVSVFRPVDFTVLVSQAIMAAKAEEREACALQAASHPTMDGLLIAAAIRSRT